MQKPSNDVLGALLSRPRGHHRRPRAIGGTDDPRNMSPDVPPHIHVLWHEAIDVMCAPSITHMLNKLSDRRDVRIVHRRTEDPLYEHPCPVHGPCANTCRHLSIRSSRLTALQELIRHIGSETRHPPTLEIAIEYINQYLIDPDYELSLVPAQEAAVAAE